MYVTIGVLDQLKERFFVFCVRQRTDVPLEHFEFGSRVWVDGHELELDVLLESSAVNVGGWCTHCGPRRVSPTLEVEKPVPPVSCGRKRDWPGPGTSLGRGTRERISAVKPRFTGCPSAHRCGGGADTLRRCLVQSTGASVEH